MMESVSVINRGRTIRDDVVRVSVINKTPSLREEKGSKQRGKGQEADP